MKTYRRIEVNAYRRRVTIVSGEWPRPISDDQPVAIDGGISLADPELCEPVAPESPEGQLILAEAVRSLERRLSPEARAAIRAGVTTGEPERARRKGFYLTLQSFYQFIWPQSRRLAKRCPGKSS